MEDLPGGWRTYRGMEDLQGDGGPTMGMEDLPGGLRTYWGMEDLQGD